MQASYMCWKYSFVLKSDYHKIRYGVNESNSLSDIFGGPGPGRLKTARRFIENNKLYALTAPTDGECDIACKAVIQKFEEEEV